MFRVLDVVDAERLENGVLFKLKHELHSAATVDGVKYMSCLLVEVPQLPRVPVRSIDEEIEVAAFKNEDSCAIHS